MSPPVAYRRGMTAYDRTERVQGPRAGVRTGGVPVGAGGAAWGQRLFFNQDGERMRPVKHPELRWISTHASGERKPRAS